MIIKKIASPEVDKSLKQIHPCSLHRGFKALQADLSDLKAQVGPLNSGPPPPRDAKQVAGTSTPRWQSVCLSALLHF